MKYHEDPLQILSWYSPVRAHSLGPCTVAINGVDYIQRRGMRPTAKSRSILIVAAINALREHPSSTACSLRKDIIPPKQIMKVSESILQRCRHQNIDIERSRLCSIGLVVQAYRNGVCLLSDNHRCQHSNQSCTSGTVQSRADRTRSFRSTNISIVWVFFCLGCIRGQRSCK